jgi:hypothetical protein
LEALVRTLAAGLAGAEAQARLSLGRLARRLWIVEKGRIRAYEEPGFEPEGTRPCLATWQDMPIRRMSVLWRSVGKVSDVRGNEVLRVHRLDAQTRYG